jgi:hypothetical protein
MSSGKNIFTLWWKNISDVCESHSLAPLYSLVNVVILVGVLCGSILYKENITWDNSDIISLLMLLILNTFGFFTQININSKDVKIIKQASSDILNSVNINYKGSDKIDKNKIGNAKKSIFISGTSMTIVSGNKDLYREDKEGGVKKGVEIIFAVSKIDNPNISDFLIESYGKNENSIKKSKTDFDSAVDYINKGRSKPVIVIDVDIFVPIAYVAVDYEEKNNDSYINAKHYLLSNKPRSDDDNTAFFGISPHPRSELYNRHLEQIKLLKDTTFKEILAKRVKEQLDKRKKKK